MSAARPQGWQRLLLALGLQVGVATLWLSLLAQTSWALQSPLAVWLLAHGLVTAGLSHWWTREVWWSVFHVVVPWLVVLALQWQLPLYIYPLLAALLLLVFSPVLRDRVPFFLSSDQVGQALLDWMDHQASRRFIDLGCATGGLLVRLAKARPQLEFVGVETAFGPWLIAWLRAWRQPNLRVLRQNLWQTDLGPYDVVYCFLSPDPMARLADQFAAQAKPGACLVSNSFQVPGRVADQTLTISDWRDSVLWVYRAPLLKPPGLHQP